MRLRYPRTCVSVGFVLVLAGGTWADEQLKTENVTRQGNVFGINLGWIPGWDTTGTVRLLGLARNLVGDWGYLRHGISPEGDVQACRESMAMIRAHHLIPIAGGAYPDKQFHERGKSYPRLDADGSMRTAARHRAEDWRRMYEAKIPFYAVEVMNEINIGDGWPAGRYAQWLYDFAVEVKKAYPGLKVCSCGMAGSGDVYYDEMLTFKPELKEVVDFWGLHPYGANHPPEYRPEGTSLRCYEETKRVLAKHGVDPIRLMCTETGYELELSDTGKDPKYPPIGEENRAAYMARAFRDYYIPEPTIDVVAVFQLWDFPWHNWNGWDLMYHDGRPRPMYEAMAAVEKSGGKDWLETGPGRIQGRVTWRDTDIGIPRVIVYVEPGLYGGVTDDEGYYEIVGLPEGDYSVTAFRDGYRVTSKDAYRLGNEPKRVTGVSEKHTPEIDWQMERASLIDPGYAQGQLGQPPAGWARFGEGKPADFMGLEEDPEKGRVLRVTVDEGQAGGLMRYGEYSSAYPGEVFIAEVWVRVNAERFEAGKGPYLELALSNGRGELTSVAKVYGDLTWEKGTWHRLTAAIYGPPRSTRVRLAYGVESGVATCWFTEPFVGEADFPLPSDAEYRTTGYIPPLYKLNRHFFAQTKPDVSARNPDLETGTIAGRVLDFRGRPLAGATVATDTPLFCAVTDEQGRYEMAVPAYGQGRQAFTLRAFALGETPARQEDVRVSAGDRIEIDLQTMPPDAPSELVNGGFNICHPKEAGLMAGWTGFGTTDGILESGHPAIIVYDKAFSYEGEGLYFAQSGSNTKNGGAYQIIQAEPGARYRVSGQVFTYTHGESKKPKDNTCQIGIDPTGGRDPDSPDVIWSEKTESEERWSPVAVEATAQTSRMTVFVRHEMRRANYWNLTMLDALELKKLEE